MLKFACYLSATAFALGAIVSSPVRSQAVGTKAKQAQARSIEVKKVFGFYDIYLGLPVSDRDGFAMAYQLRSRDGANVRPQMSYILAHVRTPIEVAANGRIITMPDLNMYRSGRVEIAAGQPSGSITMNIEPIMALSRTIAVSGAQNSINDYASAVRRAGPLAAFAPKLNGITFKGVASGEAVLADGRRVALPIGNGGVVFRPSVPGVRGATTLTFPNVPSAAEFAQQ